MVGETWTYISYNVILAHSILSIVGSQIEMECVLFGKNTYKS
jgi:hypothetical protein